MPRSVLVLALSLVFIGAVGSGARAHGEAVEIVVEALSRADEGRWLVDYGIAITFVDGDPMTGAEIQLAVSPTEGAVIEPVAETVAGVYIGRVEFPRVGEWRVVVAFDSPDSSGSVEFTQIVSQPAPEAPVVLVDTRQPNRVGSLALEATSILGGGEVGELEVRDHRFPIIVEAFIQDALAPLVIEYAVAMEGAPEDSTLILSAASERGDVVDPVTLVESSGVHRTRVEYPAAATWTVTLSVTSGSGEEVVTFGENLPWPHYTIEAGKPKVKYDSENPDRNGTIATPGDSVYLRGGDDGETSETATSAPSSPPPTGAGGQVVVDITEPAEALRVDIGLRVLHVTALGLWVVPLLAATLGRFHRLAPAAVLTGMALTVGSGVLLALWGAPVTFPGMLRWQDLAERLYGDAYLAAFLGKMAVALVAVVATSVWAARRRRVAVYVTFGAMSGAVLAVIAMNQLHLFSHL